jgi:ATP-dependent Lhr-like helicase
LEVVFDGTAHELEEVIYDILRSDLNLYNLPLPDNVQVSGKYNEFIPANLLCKQFIEDYLNFEGLREQMLEIGKLYS